MKPDAKDWCALLGVVLTATGAALIHPSLGLIVPGLFLVWLGLWRRRGNH